MKIAGVSAHWDRPGSEPQAVLVLAHGAGGNHTDAALTGIAARLVSERVAVLRFNFPYREAGRRAPGAQRQSEECYRSVASEARQAGIPLFCGGKSYGGRIASHIVADGFEVDGLVFLSYPLHAPGREDALRDAHLRSIRVPMLFVQGTKDPFARRELLQATVESLPSARLHEVDGGDHSLKVRGRPFDDVLTEAAEAMHSFLIRQR